MRQWLVYVADAAESQVNKVVVVPNYDAVGKEPPRECRPVRYAMRPGDRVWFYSAKEKKPGVVSLCAVLDGFSDNKPHPAYPEYLRSWQWPVQILARFDARPISRNRLVAIAGQYSWNDAPFTVTGTFKQGASYCHELPVAIAESLAKETYSRNIQPPFQTILDACRGTGV